MNTRKEKNTTFSLFFGFLLLMLAVLTTKNAKADPVVGVTDGNTLTVIRNHQSLIIRLVNIDAPERRQPYYQYSRQSLSDLCFKKNAEYQILSTDKQKRAIAVIHCDGVNANRAQVERGMAWVSPSHTDPDLPAIEKQARANRLGLWKDQVLIPPWEFRKKGRVIQEFPKKKAP